MQCLQCYYENGNPVQNQQQLISQYPPEFYESCILKSISYFERKLLTN